MDIEPDLINIDPGVITLIQTTFLEHINTAFATAATYAFNLLYLFAALELAVFGLVWALQRGLGWDRLVFKIIKIGLIFFVIQNFSWLLSTILESFAELAGTVIGGSAISEYIFNPAQIWQYGYNAGVNLLYLAANTDIFGLSMIQISLGMGILLVFGLLGIQMVIQIIGFYVISFGALILLPFGALTPGRNMFDKAVQAVLQAGLRLMVLIIIIGIAVVIWNGFDFVELETAGNFNLNQPMGLFFTALLFLCLALYLPKIISQAVGELSGTFLEEKPSITVTAPSESMGVITAEAPGPAANMQAATVIAPGEAAGSASYTSTITSAATIPTPTTTVTTGRIDSRTDKETLSKASKISKSISEGTIKKIKEVVSEAVKDKN